MNAIMRTVLESGVIGTASGYLSCVGVATVLTTTPSDTLPAFARSPWIRRIALVSAAGEMVGNAFISTLPSRTAPLPLTGRIVFGAASAALLAHSRDRAVTLPLIVGGVTAGIASGVAHDLQAVFARRLPGKIVGLLENGFATALAVSVARREMDT